MSLPDIARNLAQAFDQRVMRERILMAATLALVLLFLGWQLVVSPLWSGNQDLRSAIAQLNQQQSALQGQVVKLQQRLRQDPNQPLRQQRQQLEQRRDQLQQQLQGEMATLVSPEAMVPLLRRMLSAQKGLQLLAVRHLPPQPLMLDGDTAKREKVKSTGADEREKAKQPALYAHDVELVVSGSFFSVLDYLKSLESMHQHFGWRLLKYKVTDYPRAEVHLQVETLSLSKEWLGV
ncbi:type II secretion system protein GspM [Mangrovitalea sediminis]|uniref:type II secretion system protein GspM n=1 Tax=Mangrovitalea sediminis TaxID=1982043 RepID=UPI000BE50D85|nr:type II secretion system protein GspM [Mangrovitalea sediminis]